MLSVTALLSQSILEADGSSNTLDLINSVLDPERGKATREIPGTKRGDCDNHSTATEPHIARLFDKDLDKYVFKFVLHTKEDNDLCKFFD